MDCDCFTARHRRRRQRPTSSARLSIFCVGTSLCLIHFVMTASPSTAFSFSSRAAAGWRPNGAAAWSNRVSVSGNFKVQSGPPLKASTLTTTTTTETPSATRSSLSATAAVELKYMDFCRANNRLVDSSLFPVVLLHGLLGNKRNFATIGTSLSSQLERKRRIVGVDLRNHGDNHHDWRDSMSYRDMARDIIHFLDSHNMEKSILVGHSMGGKVAQATALLYPERVDGLVVLDIAPVEYTTNDANWKAVHDIVHVLKKAVPVGQPGVTKRQVDQLLAKSGGALADPALRAFCLTNLDFEKDPDGSTVAKWKIHLDGIVSQLDELAGFDIHEKEHHSAHPAYDGDTFFIHGGQSRFVRHAHMDTISKYFPNHLLTTIRGAGHWVHAEAPDDTTALLKRYLDR